MEMLGLIPEWGNTLSQIHISTLTTEIKKSIFMGTLTPFKSNSILINGLS